MKKQKSFALGVFAVLMLAAFQVTAVSQTAYDGKLANMTGGGSIVRWDVLAANSGITLTIASPDGRSFTRDFKAGAAPEFNLSERQFEGLPDGTYSYELRLRPVLTSAAREAMLKARGKDDDPEVERAGRKRPAVAALVQSGSFALVNGAVVLPGAVEGQRTDPKAATQKRESVSYNNNFARLRHHPIGPPVRPDDVIPDDLIVQGSACVGLDCVSGEVFGFDTIRLKENNTRIQFDDTSTSAGFPTNNWQIRANDSGSGGSSFLGVVDQSTTGNSETGTIIGRFTAGAPANSFVVASNGKIGLRTLTPVLDIHANTTDTPAIRLEQNNSGGFTAQTWDVAGNEANFFVRDVTSGSRLPFRIRPGAPTSSLDIGATGIVGIGTASPSLQAGNTPGVHISGDFPAIRLQATGAGGRDYQVSTGSVGQFVIADVTGGGNLGRFFITSGGNVGIATTAPTDTLSVNGTASKPGGGSWAVFSDERLKTINGRFKTGLNAVMKLQPLRYKYQTNNALGIKSETEHVGFSAQALQKVIPEAVTRNENGYLMVNNDPILWTMLNAIQEQQKQIAELKTQVRKLRATSRRRTR